MFQQNSKGTSLSLIDLRSIGVLIIVFFISLCLNILLVKYKHIIAILDIPNERSSHTYITPRSGGIAMFFAFVVGILSLDIKHSLLFLLPLSMISLVGLWDDVKGLSSKTKLLLTAIAAIVLFECGFEMFHLGTFGGYEIVLSYGGALLFFAFAVSGFVSALNLIDGLDGLASLISLAILFPFAYMGYKFADTYLFYATLILMSSILGFLVLNWHPAKIFMGDSGSMFLGFMIATVVVYAIQKEYISAISTLFLAGLPILDTLLVMLRRIIRRKNPLQADKTHIHHILLQQQQSVPKTVALLGLIQVIFSYIGLGFKVRDDSLILILYLLCFVLCYFIVINNTIPKRRNDD